VVFLCGTSEISGQNPDLVVVEAGFRLPLTIMLLGEEQGMPMKHTVLYIELEGLSLI